MIGNNEFDPRDDRKCNNCGSYVTKQFIRVFGSNNGELYGCMNCMTGRQVRDGETSVHPSER